MKTHHQFSPRFEGNPPGFLDSSMAPMDYPADFADPAPELDFGSAETIVGTLAAAVAGWALQRLFSRD